MDGYVVTDRRKQAAIIAIVAITVIMFTLDFSMVNITLPSIAKYYNIKIVEIAWVPLVYLLIVTSMLLMIGKLGDLKGYKKIFILGFLFFTAGTILCSIAPNIKALLAARAVQSVGEAMFSPIGIAILTTYLPADKQGRALGLIAMAQGLGLTAGPILGGYIASNFGWRPIFLVNVPIAIIACVFALKALPSRQAKVSETGFDLIGAILTFVGLAALVFVLNVAPKIGWLSPIALGCFAVFAVCSALFILQEKRSTHPVLDLGLFKDKNFTLAAMSAFFALCVYMGLYFLMPFYLELVHKLPMSKAGILLMTAPLGIIIASPLAGRLSDSYGSRLLCSAGMAITTVGMIGAALLTTNANTAYIAGILFLLGCAIGTFLAPNNKLIMASAPADKQGVAGGVYKMMLAIGSVVGIALMPAVLMQVLMSEAARLNIAPADMKNMPELMMKGFRSAFIFGICVCIAALVFSILAKDKEKKR